MRFRWVAVAVAWAVCLGGWAFVWAMPSTYQASAKIYVDTESVLRPLLDGLAVDTNVMSQVKMMRTVLMSRPNLERVARETDLALRAPNDASFEALVSDMPNRIGLVEGGRDNTFQLTFSDRDKVISRRVVQALLDSFVEDSIGIKKEDSNSAQRFLEEQIREYEQRLRTAEQQLADFKQQNVGLMPGESGDDDSRLQTEMQSLEALQAKARQLSERRAELVRQLDGEEPTFGFAGAGAAGPSSPLDLKIGELQKRVDALLVQFTEKHPDVVTLREQIAQLQARKRAGEVTAADVASAAADPSQAALRGLAVNPVYQNMKISLSQTEVELADVRTQLAQQQGVVAGLRGRVNTMPKVEANLAQLNRDYEVNRTQYTALLQRLESARLSDQANASSDAVKFRVIEPPMVPRLPVSPNRMLLLAAVLVFGIIAGVAAAVVFSFIRPVFSTRESLAAATARPVVGVIMKATAEANVPLWRRDFILLAAAYGMLVATFGGLVLAVNLSVQKLLES